MVNRTGFGALPIQRIDMESAKKILLKAYDQGINFFDTARAYSDSEEKIGEALSAVRKDIIIATKTHGTNREEVINHLETSLKKLKTDYVDILQLHNPPALPDTDQLSSAYSGLVELKNKGMVRFIGITNHKLQLALEAVESGYYDTVQYPLSSLSTEKELALIELCRKRDIGLIAMKALSGGLITNTASAFAFLRQYDNLLPIWGVQEEWQLDQFVAFEEKPPILDEHLWAEIEKDRAELSGSFCRACGYCMPCPVGIPISQAARMSLLLNRAPRKPLLTEEWKEKMELINDCLQCNQCKDSCPYNLNTPELLKEMLVIYEREYKLEHSS